MQKRGISQETLKIIACITMLVDHVGAVFYQRTTFFVFRIFGQRVQIDGNLLRIIGRIAFPIFCYLLVEGALHTRNPRKYAIRLAVGALLSEIPFDIAFCYGLTLKSQNVMITLLLGFLALEGFKRYESSPVRFVISAVTIGLAEIMNTDYGGYGVLLIILFSQTRGQLWLQAILLALVAWIMPQYPVNILGVQIPIEMFAVLAMIPISMYSGRKSGYSRAVQWGFYLFYPVHILTLVVIRYLTTGLPTPESVIYSFRILFLR